MRHSEEAGDGGYVGRDNKEHTEADLWGHRPVCDKEDDGRAEGDESQIRAYVSAGYGTHALASTRAATDQPTASWGSTLARCAEPGDEAEAREHGLEGSTRGARAQARGRQARLHDEVAARQQRPAIAGGAGDQRPQSEAVRQTALEAVRARLRLVMDDRARRVGQGRARAQEPLEQLHVLRRAEAGARPELLVEAAD